MYTAVPFEMLRTAHEKPQIRINIDGMPAICVGLKCDYQYEVPTGLVTGMSVSGLDVSLTGTNLPLNNLKVRVAQTNCEVTSNSEDSIECTLVTPWVAGKWLPAVRDSKGLIPNKPEVQPHEVPYVVTHTDPANVNVAGYEVITFFGENFPSNLGDFPDMVIRWVDEWIWSW